MEDIREISRYEETNKKPTDHSLLHSLVVLHQICLVFFGPLKKCVHHGCAQVSLYLVLQFRDYLLLCSWRSNKSETHTGKLPCKLIHQQSTN